MYVVLQGYTRSIMHAAVQPPGEKHHGNAKMQKWRTNLLLLIRVCGDIGRCESYPRITAGLMADRTCDRMNVSFGSTYLCRV